MMSTSVPFSSADCIHHNHRETYFSINSHYNFWRILSVSVVCIAVAEADRPISWHRLGHSSSFVSFVSRPIPPVFPTSSTTIRTKTSLFTASSSSKWYPVHPADALSPHNDYNSLVVRAYIRHLLVETEDMAQELWNIYSCNSPTAEAMQTLSTGSTYPLYHGDSFAKMARDISLCVRTREEGGTIGWIDNPFYYSNGDDQEGAKHIDNNSSIGQSVQNKMTLRKNEAVSEIISPHVIQEVFRRRVKGGDVVKISATENSGSDSVRGWHLIRIDDLHLRPPWKLGMMDASSSSLSKNIIHTKRPKLRGSGVAPLSPHFQNGKEKLEIASVKYDDEEEQSLFSRKMYSIPNAKYYKILTTGCQMNVADSERIMGVLEDELGLISLDESSVSSDSDCQNGSGSLDKASNKSKKKSNATPDVILLNTCTIRDHAEQKVYDALGPYASLKRSGHPLAIVVAGCVAQQEGEALLRRFPEIDLVMGPQYIPWLGDLLVEVGKGSQLCMTESVILSEKGAANGWDKEWDSSREKDNSWMVPIKRGHAIRAWINVIYGCNEHCTYCVVPAVRGVEQSRSMEAIFRECLQLASSGYKEITLLGQNIDAYGRDMTPKRTFAELLHYLNDNLPPGTISRIRYVTSHPRYFSDRVIDAVANLDKVCECFHVPFQAGDDKVLRDMRRGYTYDSYMNIIRRIRAKAPDASICGDVIVGFPGETEEEFQRTLNLMEEVKFDNLNTFAYSRRPNTEAATWTNQVPIEVQSDRLIRVQALAAKHALERSQRFVGSIMEVLVEDRNPKNAVEIMGRIRQGRQVFFEGNIEELRGALVMVEILEARTWSLVGKLVKFPDEIL